MIVYALTDPRTEEVRYIGITTDFKRRLRRHMAEAQGGSKRHLHNWLRRLGRLPGHFILEECDTREELNEAERFWIDWYRRNTPFRLTNLTEGGDGGDTSAHWTPEGKARIVAASMGRIPSAEQREKVGAAHRGMKRSAETRARISRSMKRMHAEGRGRWGTT